MLNLFLDNIQLIESYFMLYIFTNAILTYQRNVLHYFLHKEYNIQIQLKNNYEYNQKAIILVNVNINIIIII